MSVICDITTSFEAVAVNMQFKQVWLCKLHLKISVKIDVKGEREDGDEVLEKADENHEKEDKNSITCGKRIEETAREIID